MFINVHVHCYVIRRLLTEVPALVAGINFLSLGMYDFLLSWALKIVITTAGLHG